MSSTAWWSDVEAIIQKYSLMEHPYNVAWREGCLELKDVQEYCRQYFHHVDFFPKYVSAVHSNTPDMETRQMLLENLVEEEQGSENHPELFLRFSEGAGLQREDVTSAELRDESKDCVKTFMELARNPNHLAGLAALYAYESQQAPLSATKVERLDVHYGIIDERAYKYFKVHMGADEAHSSSERQAIQAKALSEEDQELVKQSVEAACKALYGLFDGVDATRQVAQAA